MIEARTDINPGNWQITATTIQCQYVNEAVTIMVNSNWETRCATITKRKGECYFDSSQRRGPGG